MTSLTQAIKVVEGLIAKARGGGDQEIVVFAVAENEDASERIERTLAELGIDHGNALVIEVVHLHPAVSVPVEASPRDALDAALPVA